MPQAGAIARCALLTLAMAREVHATCSVELQIVPEESTLAVSGMLQGIIDIDLEDEPPRAQGSLVLSTDRSCPESPEAWTRASPLLSSANVTVEPSDLHLKAAVVHVLVHGAQFTFPPTPLVADGESGAVRADPAVTIAAGAATIGHKNFSLLGGKGDGEATGRLSRDAMDALEMELSDVSVVFKVDLPEIEGTHLDIKGSIVARQRPAPGQAVAAAAAPLANAVVAPSLTAAVDAADLAAADTAPVEAQAAAQREAATASPPDARALAAAEPVCSPDCGARGTCVQAPGAHVGVGVCECRCNFVGVDCSEYAPLRLSTVVPDKVDFGTSVRVRITGSKLGKLAALPAPLDGPAFSVRLADGSNCTGLEVVSEDAVACTVPAQPPGTTVRFDVRRGCAKAPFAPRAQLKVAGCGPPSALECQGNQLPAADGCVCECAPGWRGQMCTACAADAACASLFPAAPRRSSAAPAVSDGGGEADAAGGMASGDGGDDQAGVASADQLTCHADDYAFYAGTWQKALSCTLENLPEGIEPLAVSLVCTREAPAGAGHCNLTVAPADDEDRAAAGPAGALTCLATGCTFDNGRAAAHCSDVSCNLGMYEPAIRQAMPDLKVGGPSELHCEALDGGGRGSHVRGDVARCYVDLDVLPVDIVAQCSVSDCVDPTALAAQDEDGIRRRTLVIAASAAVLALVLLCACAIACARWLYAPSAAGGPVTYAVPYAGAADTFLPDDFNVMPRVSALVFRDVRVRVAAGREVVRGASGCARSGKVYGVIGASGSGKTTLLDAVAGVIAPGASRTGDVLLDGHSIPERGVRLPALVGYVRQEDNLSLTLTPRECVHFAAALTLPRDTSAVQRAHAVDSTLAALGLSHIADTQLGGTAAAMQRVSGGERRRVAIAMSMVASPRVLLLDEPTSGLDSASAHRLVATLRMLAAQDRVVMLSIHQPAQRTFELLDSALLMHQGLPVTVGPIKELRAAAQRAGVPCPPEYNLADHLLDVTGDAAAVERLRAESAEALAPDAVAGATVAQEPPPWALVHAARGCAGEVGQLRAELGALYWRIGLSVYRHPALLRLHLVVVLILAAAVGLVFHGVGNNLASFQNRSGACFFVLALFGFSGLSAMEVFIAEHELMLRELQAGYYRLSAYFVAKISVDAVLLRALPAVLFSLIFYPVMGLRPEASRFGTFTAVCTLVNVASGLLCAAISVLFESLGAANLAATILMLLLLLMNGALVNLREVARPLQVGQSASFFRYGFEALLTNELEDTIVMVDAPGITPIPVKSRVFLGVLGMDAQNIPRDTRILGAFCIGHAALAALLLYWRATTWRPPPCRIRKLTGANGEVARGHTRNGGGAPAGMGVERNTSVQLL